MMVSLLIDALLLNNLIALQIIVQCKVKAFKLKRLDNIIDSA